MEKKKLLNSKNILMFSTITKVPLLIYLVLTISTVPAIDTVKYNHILGAHRGDSVTYIENTLPAIQKAVEEEKYKFIEFDIQYTKDKKIILFHDSNLLRMKQKPYSVINLTHEELQNIVDFSIPLYKDTMDSIENKKKINIEIKTSGNIELDKELTDYIINDVKQRGILENIMISSVSADIVKYVSDTYPEIKTGKIYWLTSSTYLHFDFLTKQLYDEMEKIGADYLMLHGANLHNINSLLDLKPKDKTLAIWYFTDEMYIIQKDDTDDIW